MTLVVGQESEGNGASEVLSNERGIAIRFEALATLTVETLKYKTGSSTNGTAASVRLGILNDATTVPGATLIGSEGVITGTPVKETVFEATGIGAALTASSKYWLVVLPVGGTTRLKLSVGITSSAIPETSGKGATIAQLKNWATGLQGPAFIAGTDVGAATLVVPTMVV